MFPALSPSCVLPALGSGFIFSRAWIRLRVFPRLASAAYFPALDSGFIFSRAWIPLRVFPRLASAAYFPALGSSCVFSRAWLRLYIFPRLSTAPCFPTLGLSCISFHAYLRLLVFPPFALVAYFCFSSDSLPFGFTLRNRSVKYCTQSRTNSFSQNIQLFKADMHLIASLMTSLALENLSLILVFCDVF